MSGIPRASDANMLGKRRIPVVNLNLELQLSFREIAY